jgi:hypothetical protein
MRLTTGEQLREMAKLLPRYEVTADNADVFRSRIAELEQDCRNYLHEVEQVKAELAALKGKAAVPEGWQLVPKIPTQAMVDCAKSVDGRLSVFKWADGYYAMLAAAPDKPQSDAVMVPIALLEELRDCANDCYNNARMRGTSGLDAYKRLTERADALLGGEA